MQEVTTISKQKKRMQTSRADALTVPPHSIEAEQSVLGGLMLDNSRWDDVREKLSDEDFYRHDHGLIFAAMDVLNVRDCPIDALTVVESLKERGHLENVGDEVYIFELVKNVPSAANVVAYAEIVRERSILRQLIQVSNEVAGSAFHTDGQAVTELLDTAERKILGIAEQHTRGSGPQEIKGLLAEAVEHVDKLFQSKEPLTGMPSGFKDLDDKTSGMQRSDLIIVAGRPSMGKTALAMNIAESVALKAKEPVLVFSMEMSGSSLALRMMSSLGRIDQHRVRTGRLEEEDWARITSSVSMLSETQLYIDDTPALSPAELRSRARRVAKNCGKKLGLIVVDYLQLMHCPESNENRTVEITAISRSLKALAKELDVPVIALSQLNRSLEQRADKRPVMSDLRESGAIEQDADLIAFIYRDEVYNEESRDKGVAEIIIGKQRNGPIGKVRLAFLGKYTRFENIAMSDADY
jgi:replicative DNA helicase